TLQMGREPLRHRWAAICRDHGDAVRQLQSFADGGETGYRGRAAAGAGAVPAEADLPTIAAAWVTGAEIAWASRYSQRVRKVALPSYPFTRMRCWIDPERHGMKIAAQSDAPVRSASFGSGRRVQGPGGASSLPALAERVWHPDPEAAHVEIDESLIPPVLFVVTQSTELLG